MKKEKGTSAKLESNASNEMCGSLSHVSKRSNMELLEKFKKIMLEAEDIEGPECILLMTAIIDEANKKICGILLHKRHKLTLEEFRNTGHNVCFKNEDDIWNSGLTEFGRVYAGKTYIELRDDGEWMLTIGNSQFTGRYLQLLEKRLYEEFYLTEVTHD